MCLSPTWNEECAAQQVYTSPGAFGFMPWIDRVNQYYALIGVVNINSASAIPNVLLAERMMPSIVEALTIVRLIPSSSSVQHLTQYLQWRGGSVAPSTSISLSGSPSSGALELTPSSAGSSPQPSSPQPPNSSPQPPVSSPQPPNPSPLSSPQSPASPQPPSVAVRSSTMTLLSLVMIMVLLYY